jgi:Sec-independent protein translocase protein TatA
MPFTMGELVVIGAVAAAVIIGPKRLFPRMAQSLKQARNLLDTKETTEKIGQETTNALKETTKEKEKNTSEAVS